MYICTNNEMKHTRVWFILPNKRVLVQHQRNKNGHWRDLILEQNLDTETHKSKLLISSYHLEEKNKS